MATAVSNSTETSPAAPNPQSRLLSASVVGAAFVAACVVIVTMLVPLLWKNALEVLGTLNPETGLSPFQLGGQAVLQIAMLVGLIVLAVAVAGANPPAGMRAGTFTILATLLLGYLVTLWIGGLLERNVFKGAESQTIGLIVMTVIGLAMLVAAARFALKPKFAQILVAFENHGWFGLRSYKASQGLRVRRLTMLGILILVGSGIYTLYSHNSLTGHWAPKIPFSAGRYLPLLRDLRYTGPLLLAALGMWISWRAVNYPTFADFLIATEAEMNKVSWTTRKRLIQDTIVVLVTVVLFSAFLLIVDQLWGWILTRETLGGVVPKPVPKVQSDNPQEQPW